MGRTVRVLPLVGFLLTGCTVMSGAGLEEASVDRTLLTGSIAPQPTEAPDSDSDSDGRTIRNAVSAADVTRAPLEPLAWQNTETGASGRITAIHETRDGNAVCRTFRTSRQRFDGVAILAGEACTSGSGEWTLTKFSEGE